MTASIQVYSRSRLQAMWTKLEGDSRRMMTRMMLNVTTEASMMMQVRLARKAWLFCSKRSVFITFVTRKRMLM